MRQLRAWVPICLLVLIAPSVYAGAWVPEIGSGYHKLAWNDFEADDFFGANEGFEQFENQSVTYYFEVGVAEDIALFGSVPFQDLSQRINGVTTTSSGLGDVELGLRHNWIDGPFVLSGAFIFKAPYFYDEDEALPLGNGQEDYEGRLLFGKSLNEYGYFGLELGYRARSGAPSDEIRYLLEYGTNINDNLYFRTKLDAIESVGNASESLDGIGNLSVPPEFDLGKWELTLGWNFGRSGPYGRGRWGAEVTYTQDAFGDDTLDGDTLQIGFTLVH